MAQKSSSQKPKSVRQEASAPSATPDETHVPDWAENMEHTLRRLARQKEAKRAKNPGLYR
ncbi:MAG: hypothetical protein QNI90_05610 [Dinoroseobacter sp.]|nr:hypothetical protein [Dinoroseobacter sp.]